MCAFTMGMIVVIALCTLIMGLVLGMLGGGGSILTVPILTYLAGMEPGAAVASSLVVVGATRVVGVVMHARSQAVQWTTGSVFGAVAMVGAYGGGRLAALFPGWLLLVLFASMMVATAVMMLRARREDSPRVTRDVSVWMIVAEGLVVGAATGLVGAGGGFLVVPALVVLGGLSMRDAIGTSLLVIALKSTAGLAGHLSHIAIDWPVTLLITALAVVGAFGGTAISARLSANVLRVGFAWFVLVMGVVILGTELWALVV